MKGEKLQQQKIHTRDKKKIKSNEFCVNVLMYAYMTIVMLKKIEEGEKNMSQQ